MRLLASPPTGAFLAIYMIGAEGKATGRPRTMNFQIDPVMPLGTAKAAKEMSNGTIKPRSTASRRTQGT
jgi:hypothetical protein